MTGRSRARFWYLAWLGVVLVLALLLRLQGIRFGLPALLDPDEPIFLLLALRMIKEHTLNPAWFGHPGTTTIYCLALIEMATFAVGHVLGWFPDSAAFAKAIYTDPSILFVPGRLFILLCGLVTIILTFALARRLFDTRIASIAALALAIDPLHIRYSQIIRTDMQASVFMLLELLAAVAIVRRGDRRDYIFAGIALGLACATKWPAAASVVGVFGAALLRLLEHPQEFGQLSRRTLLFIATAIATLLLTSPFLILDFDTVLANLHGEERPFHLGATGFGLVGNAVWYVKGPFLRSLGPIGLLLALAGFVIGMRRSSAFAAIILPVAVTFMVMISAQALVWERWIVPILPLATIAMAVGVVAILDIFRRYWSGVPLTAASGLMALLVILPLAATVRSFARERVTDTRTQATAWARARIAPGSKVAVEHMAFDVLRQPWTFLYPAGDAGCVNVRANLNGEISYAQIGRWRGMRSVVDIGTVAPQRLSSCRGDWAILVNWDRYRAEATRFSAEVANYDRFVQSGRVVATFAPVPGEVGGPVVRIVQFPQSTGDLHRR